MSRSVPFNEIAKCDGCGATGAFDFMGDYFCADCAGTLVEKDEAMTDQPTTSTAEQAFKGKPAFCEPDDKRLTFCALDKAQSGSGICNVRRNRWWSVHPERGLIFFKGSPQCNSSQAISERHTKALYPWAECRFIECVITEVDPRDYVHD